VNILYSAVVNGFKVYPFVVRVSRISYGFSQTHLRWMIIIGRRIMPVPLLYFSMVREFDQ